MNPEPARFLEPITFTDLTPRLLSEECEAWLTTYKEALLAGLLKESGKTTLPELLSQALNEADSLASLTPFPALFLPALAEEKVAASKAWLKRQRRLLGGPVVALAA